MLQHADASELAKSGDKLLSARGSLTVDKRTNRLFIHDDAAHLSTLTAWAQEMDLPVGQVELAAHIVSMSETSLRELGVKWSMAEASSAPGSGKLTTLSSHQAVNDASTRVGFNIGRLSGRLLELELSALEQNSRWKSSPARVCWLLICSLPASSRVAKFPIRSPAGKAAQHRLSLKRRFWEWRSRQRFCNRIACA